MLNVSTQGCGHSQNEETLGLMFESMTWMERQNSRKSHVQSHARALSGKNHLETTNNQAGKTYSKS